MAGARPNFVKLAPLVRAAAARGCALPWVHTGQHGAARLARSLWRDVGLGLPARQAADVASGPRRAERMARAVVAELLALRPSRVVVVGDVDSTLAGALAARRLHVPLAHVEAGLRCGDLSMPEERNRRRVDRASDLLHVSERAAVAHLRREGVPASAIHRAGNVLADQLDWARPRLTFPGLPALRALRDRPFGVVTLHRPANVDEPGRLERWGQAFCRVASALPLVFPVHPRTRARLGAAACRRLRRRGVLVVPPLSYLHLLGLLERSALVLTDSGGLPVEAALLGRPCLVLRPRYEQPLVLSRPGVKLAGGDPRRLVSAVTACLVSPREPRPARPPEWDGHAAARIVRRWQSAHDTPVV